MMKRVSALSLALLLPVQVVVGDDTLPAETVTEVKRQVGQFLPGYPVDSVRKAPVAGLYEIAIGTRVLYLTQDGAHLLLGDVIDAEQRVNLTEERRAELISARIEKVGTEKMIVIGSGQAQRHITVFTDVDCPYCAKFHRDVPKLNEAGLEVRYVLFPRSGIGSKSYKRAVGVWCSDDPVKMVGIAKAGGAVAEKQCDNPVKESMDLGREVGISGTPAIVLDNGRLIPGYVPPEQLLVQLGMASTEPGSKK